MNRGTDMYDDRPQGNRREDGRSRWPPSDQYGKKPTYCPEGEFGGRRTGDDRRDWNGTDTYYGPAFKKRGKKPSDLPGTDTYHGSAYKKRKTGNLDPEYGKTKGAMRVVLSHWLNIQHDGYHGASRPKD